MQVISTGLHWLQNFIGILGGLTDFCLYTMGYLCMITRNVITKSTWSPVYRVWGGDWQNLVYPLPVVYGYKNLNIAHLEMVNILVAVRAFCGQWASKSILIHCDNQAVVSVLQSGKARDPFWGACARNIWLWATTYDIELSYVHLLGKYNRTADLLSRWSNSVNDQNEFKMLVPAACWVPVTLEMTEIDNAI